MPQISVIVITFGRREELEGCLRSILDQEMEDFEVILIDNNVDEEISQQVTKTVDQLNNGRIKHFDSPDNLGVAGGRNLGIEKAAGDILVFIDDDAFFERADSLSNALQLFGDNPELGAIAFKIIDYSSRRIQRKEFPHRNKKLNPDQQFETTYFVGAGFAARKMAITRARLFCEDFFYGMEELDLSFRLLDVGYRIFYYPEVIVWHKPSSSGRLVPGKVWQNTLENRLKLSLRNLPWKYVIISAVIWSTKVFLETKGSIPVLLRAYKKLWVGRQSILKSRMVIGEGTIEKLQRLQGRLYY